MYLNGIRNSGGSFWIYQYSSFKKMVIFTRKTREGKIICMLCAHMYTWSIGKWDFCIHDCVFRNTSKNCMFCIHADGDLSCERPSFLCVCLKSPVLLCLRENTKTYIPQIKNSEQTGPNWCCVYSSNLFSNFYVIVIVKIIQVIKSRKTRGGGNLSRIEGKRGAYWLLVGKI